MRIKRETGGFLRRRRDLLQDEISSARGDPEGVVFVGGPLTVLGRGPAGQGKVEGPSGAIGLGFLGPVGSDVQARPLLRHIRTSLGEGRSDLSKRISQRMSRFVERKLNAVASPQRSPSRELRGGR